MAKDEVKNLATADDYPKWSEDVSALLMAAHVWRHISSVIVPVTPANASAPTVEETRELRIHSENEETTMGIVLQHLDTANRRLIAKLTTAKAIWDHLKTTHVKQTENRQYQLYQDMANVRQEPSETLPIYLARMETAADRLSSSLASGASADDVIGMLVTFLTMQNLDRSEENENFEINLTVAGKLSRSNLADAFSNKQTRRDVANRTNESGLATRITRTTRQSSNRPTCSHCQKAHKSDNCYKRYPEKMPQWMKDKNEAQRKLREQRKATPQPTDGAHVAASEEPEDDDDKEEEGEAESVMMAKPEPASSNSTVASLPSSSPPNHAINQVWLADSGATTPNRHWIRNMVPCCVPVNVASGEVVYASSRGEVLFQPRINGVNVNTVIFSHVLYVPSLQNNLFAVLPAARKRDVAVLFNKRKVHFKSTLGETFMTASYKAKAAYLDGETIPAPVPESAMTTTSSPPITLALLHRRMAHIGSDHLKKLVKLEMAKGITPKDLAKCETQQSDD
ncbi:hypothetical protein FRC01_012082, partial [Tulasnella sp. 417]